MLTRFPLTAARSAAPQAHLPGESRFLTLLLVDALPAGLGKPALPLVGADEAARHIHRKRQFARLDAQLPHAPGPAWLRSGTVARLVRTELHRAHERQLLGLLAYAVLPNHLHLVVRLAPDPPVALGHWLARFKSRTAQLANRALGRDGPFWAADVLELPVADPAELQRLVAYVRQDPVRAGLIRDAAAWPHTWLSADFW